MLEKLIRDNYDIEVKSLSLFDSHFGTEIFVANAVDGKYIVKTLPSLHDNLESEGRVTDYLHGAGISVARLIKTVNNMYHVQTDKMQFHIQEFIEGKVLHVNTAPGWFLDKSADILGKIHCTLRIYEELPINFGVDFFDISTVDSSKRYYAKRLTEAKQDQILVRSLEERLKHLERISAFKIDVDKITYSNSHGDFHIGQIITKGEEITVIDWTAACKLPICLEVIMSFVTADPFCKDGSINIDRLRRYIDIYSRHFTLTDYDMMIMPYVLYYQQLICHYSPPYHEVAESYKPMCKLINNFTDWLYENVEILSEKLRT